MLLIFAASTDLMSAEHTSRFLEPVLRWLDPGIAPATVAAVQFGVRKLAHLTEYAILAALVARALCNSLQTWQWRYAFLVVCIAAGYAALDEFHQSFVVSRTASARDVFIDSAGAIVGVLCYCKFAPRPRVAEAPRPIA